jgi:hypothetical protein
MKKTVNKGYHGFSLPFLDGTREICLGRQRPLTLIKKYRWFLGVVFLLITLIGRWTYVDVRGVLTGVLHGDESSVLLWIALFKKLFERIMILYFTGCVLFFSAVLCVKWGTLDPRDFIVMKKFLLRVVCRPRYILFLLIFDRFNDLAGLVQSLEMCQCLLDWWIKGVMRCSLYNSGMYYVWWGWVGPWCFTGLCWIGIILYCDMFCDELFIRRVTGGVKGKFNKKIVGANNEYKVVYDEREARMNVLNMAQTHYYRIPVNIRGAYDGMRYVNRKLVVCPSMVCTLMEKFQTPEKIRENGSSFLANTGLFMSKQEEVQVKCESVFLARLLSAYRRQEHPESFLLR